MSEISVAQPPATRRVLVTGGTGTIGQAVIEAFSGAGDTVVFQYCEDVETAARLEERWSATALRLDFTVPFSLPSTDFDVLINCAGVNESDRETHLVDEVAWARMVQLNLTAPFLLIRMILPGMMERGWGRIVNVGSIYSVRGAVRRAPYVASKHGLSGLTKTVAKEYAEYGITSNEICPGAVESKLLERIAGDRARQEGRPVAEMMDEYRALNPSKRLARAVEVASLALYLASADAGFISGASIVVDGGSVA